MALQEPPPNIPKIVEVQNPSEGQYVVVVRVPTNLASTFPDKPWGTGIEKIGLPKKESDMYPDYTLVDIEPVQGTSDLYWVFQKLDGPIWETKSQGQDSLIPAKFRRMVTTIQTRQDVGLDAQPDTPAGDLAQSVVQQQENTGKAVKVNTSEKLDADAEPMSGELTDTWGINTTEERVVEDGDPVDSGFGVKSSRVVPLGNGKSVKETENYPDPLDTVLVGTEVDESTGAVVSVSKSLVPAGTVGSGGLAGSVVEVQPVDKWHSIQIASSLIVPPVGHSWFEKTYIKLPPSLQSVGVTWNSTKFEDGGAAGVDNIDDIVTRRLEWSVTAEAVCSLNITGAPLISMGAGYAGTVPVKVERTFHAGVPNSSQSQGLELVSGYGTLTIIGFSGMKSQKAVKRGIGNIDLTSQIQNSFKVNDNVSVHTVGPVVNVNAVDASTNYPDSAFYSAIGGSTPAGGSYPTATVALDGLGVATVVLPPVSPNPNGKEILLKESISYWRYGYYVKDRYTYVCPSVY